MKRVSLVSLVVPAMFSVQAFASILPPNNLHLEDNIFFAPNMTEQEFNTISNSIIDQYKPLATLHGGTLSANNRWTDATVNASAEQKGSGWVVNMYGGLARRPEVTPDGFAMVVCHEIGHHFGGFSFYQRSGGDWAANEGQSDYFATQSCARKIWKAETQVNATFRATVGATEKAACDKAWKEDADQDLCYRTAAAGLSLGTLLGKLGNTGAPSFDSVDKSAVRKTNDAHPKAQCRLDTYLRGAQCPVAFDEKIIPGRKNAKGQKSKEAELEAVKYSCSTMGELAEFARPTCWFKSQLK